MQKPRFEAEGVRHATLNGHRLHLRLTDPTKDNFLWINGQQPPLILDQTAAEFMGYLIDALWRYQQGDGDNSQEVIDYVVSAMHTKYARRGITQRRIKEDLDRIFATIMAIANGACPVGIGLASKEIHYGQWNGPARMDLAVTYRCNLACQKCYASDKKGLPELGLADWLKIYKTLWSIGIPQIVFTGGEPLMRDDIVELVSEADEFVTGLITNGTLLAPLAESLRNASLDYVQITIESYNPETHDKMTNTPGSHQATVAGIKKALEVGLQVTTNTTLTALNAWEFIDTIFWLSRLGVKHVACNSLICSGRGAQCKIENGLTDEGIRHVLEEACGAIKETGLDLQWYTPTCYGKGLNPLELGLGIKTCSAAAHNMTIQPDGSVLPCQSWPETVGHILTDKWTDIWNHPISRTLREHGLAAKECLNCEAFALCGGGCPLDKSPRQRTITGGDDK